ncbi:hypothetical protein C4K88_12160 [Arthrobacter pityocampae]|uniref:Uncharacterized protein n=1 Tax=Arthrobacter pityocampae TaxID=547334 RepID=A0A2S5IVD8_9MICC|nr:hypothetical protein [Arthrobacter pityocampae]PPB48497.1 hypothetical protein C4K88_12160 [Arthrobacter pityocampae]
MSEKSSDTPTSESEEQGTEQAVEQGAEQAGAPDEQDAGGYGGPATEDEVAPGFEAHNDGATGA